MFVLDLERQIGFRLGGESGGPEGGGDSACDLLLSLPLSLSLRNLLQKLLEEHGNDSTLKKRHLSWNGLQENELKWLSLRLATCPILLWIRVIVQDPF